MSNYKDEWHRGGVTNLISGTITQVVAAPSPIGIRLTIPKGTEMELLSYRLSAGDTGGGRTYTILHLDAAGDRVMLIDLDALDNTNIYGPVSRTSITQTTATVDALGVPSIPYLISGTDILSFEGASLLDTETFKIVARLRIRGKIPALTALGAGISVAGFTNKII